MTEDELETKIAEWHDSDSELELYEYLGWNWEQYKAWGEKGIIPNDA